ncbi:PadR family transcriptional regulator [Natronobacterium gregoryi]|uniref:Transcriptional regulator n=2 Tax=Natronobacterium gregoryi TaxID=44930 RepID=L0AFU0_NATGS|nr:PadR family transcriptional regulator [Natronobacterium gregoryi]AFZ71925.1 putative transcriptional regulator [Natronobacterium gregoryi SP2]ELY62579.1 transcriptional regulator PadR family protein [Natronobacterium gregoryi SP2]PLK20705.1 PadR family transcriptional regulator [Natronobacterium gregoryi SP2]SFJ13777.1 transcriptional regulator, PadR family [Natronobacterium gregoryi]
MSKWLQSGRRRDVCFLLAAEGEDGALRGQELKSRLESHYDERLEPKSFYGSLSALVDAGFVEKRTAGLHDVYALTEAGRRRVSEHYAWINDCLKPSRRTES